MASYIPPYTYIHSVTLATIERTFLCMRIISTFCIGITQLLNKFTIRWIDIWIITLKYRHKVRITSPSELGPRLNTIWIQCDPFLSSNLFQLYVVGCSVIPCYVSSGNISIIIRRRIEICIYSSSRFSERGTNSCFIIVLSIACSRPATYSSLSL